MGKKKKMNHLLPPYRACHVARRSAQRGGDGMEGAGRVHARRVFCPSIDLPLSGEGGGRHAGGRGGEEGYGRGTRMGNGREGGGLL